MKPIATAHKRIAVISCVHGNMEALEHVLLDIDRQAVNTVVCLGDLVGYGPHPNEVIRTLQQADVRVVLGCWDEGVGNEAAGCGCNYPTEDDSRLGKIAFSWTCSEVTAENKEYLRGLPHGIRLQGIHGLLAFVHGSPRSTSEYLTESTHELILLERAASSECRVLVCGHTHVPFVREVSGSLTVKLAPSAQWERDPKTGRRNARTKEVQLAPKLIVNAGSVGEPRHGGLESTYVIIDSETLDVQIRKVAYPVEKVAEAMRSRNFPSEFIDRLQRGQEMIGKLKDITCAC